MTADSPADRAGSAAGAGGDPASQGERADPPGRARDADGGGTEGAQEGKATDWAAVTEGSAPHRCDRCGRPFAAERYLRLHRGLDHGPDLSAAEREAFREAYEAEEADLRRFRILALGGLVALYFGFLFAFAVFAS